MAVIALAFLSRFKRVRNYGIAGDYRNRTVLTEPEQVLYWRLKEVLDDRFVLCSQVSFSAFIEVDGYGREKYSKFGRARQKVADFVICNKGFKPLLVIELDDRSHDRDKDVRRDRILNEAGIEVVRFNVSKIPDKTELEEVLLGRRYL